MSKNQNSDRWEQFNFIVDTEELNLKEKSLLLILFRYVNYKSKYADPSRELIKKLLKIGKDNRTLDNLFDSLISKGFLFRESGKKGKRSRYYLKLDTKITTTEDNALDEEIMLEHTENLTSQKENKKQKLNKSVDENVTTDEQEFHTNFF